MLVVRLEKIRVFEQAALRCFEDEMVAHLARFAPKHCEVFGGPDLRQVIRLGIERPSSYGLTNRGPVRFYIEMMLQLGSDFDTDSHCHWIGDILAGASIRNQMRKLHAS